MTTPDQPGWYDELDDPNAQRYWDGNTWTPHRQRKSISRPEPPPVTSTPTLPPPPPPPWLPPTPDQQTLASPSIGYPPPSLGAGYPPPPSDAAPGPRPRLALIAVVVAAVIAVGGVAAYKWVLPGLASPEDQIRTLVKTITDDYNNADGAGMAKLWCSQSTGGKGFTGLGAAIADANLRELLDENGPITTSVTNIRVTGDRATAAITTTKSKGNHGDTETMSFAKENGSWKICQ